MPPKILRCEDTPKSPVVWHSIAFKSPTEKIQKEKRKQDDNEATDGKQNGCTSEVHLVEGSPNEKASSRGEQESPTLEKKKKRRKIRGDKLEAQLDMMEHVVKEEEDIIDHLIIPSGEKLRNPMECDLVNISCEEKSVLVGVDEISEVGVDENMNGFPVSEKKVKKIKTTKKKKKHVDDEEKTKESLENNGVENEPTHNCNQVVPREKETENENAGKSRKKLKKKRVKEDFGTQEKEVSA